VVEILPSNFFAKGEQKNWGIRSCQIMTNKVFTFIKAENLGKCPCCNEDVQSDKLFVEEDKNVYHLSCYNHMKADEKK
jgi:hypothetical protein